MFKRVLALDIAISLGAAYVMTHTSHFNFALLCICLMAAPLYLGITSSYRPRRTSLIVLILGSLLTAALLGSQQNSFPLGSLSWPSVVPDHILYVPIITLAIWLPLLIGSLHLIQRIVTNGRSRALYGGLLFGLIAFIIEKVGSHIYWQRPAGLTFSIAIGWLLLGCIATLLVRGMFGSGRHSTTLARSMSLNLMVWSFAAAWQHQFLVAGLGSLLVFLSARLEQRPITPKRLASPVQISVVITAYEASDVAIENLLDDLARQTYHPSDVIVLCRELTSGNRRAIETHPGVLELVINQLDPFASVQNYTNGELLLFLQPAVRLRSGFLTQVANEMMRRQLSVATARRGHTSFFDGVWNVYYRLLQPFGVGDDSDCIVVHRDIFARSQSQPKIVRASQLGRYGQLRATYNS